jgi:hypothetical protein
MELMECKVSFSALLIRERFLLARKRLEYVMGGGSRPFPKDMEVRSKALRGTDIGDLYRTIIKEIVDLGWPTSDRALSALSWIWKSKEPLAELVLQVAIGADSTADILSFCKSLVIFSDSGYFQFSHVTTVTEFLAEPKIKDLEVRLPSSLVVTEKCLEFLNDTPAAHVDWLRWDSRNHGRPRNFSLIRGFPGYVSERWVDHVRDDQCSLFKRGVDDLDRFEFWTSQTKRESLLDIFRQPANSTILHFIAEHGLTDLCRILFEAKAKYIESIDSTNM